MSAPAATSVHELQQRVRRMEGTSVSRDLDLLPGLAGSMSLRTGTVSTVDSLGLALALLAGPSQAGEWSAVVGIPDLGWHAAADFGVDLTRTVWVPDPGEHWLSVAAGLVDVTTVVVVRPPGLVSEHQASRLVARLRQRDAALLVCGSPVTGQGAWPRAHQRLSVTDSCWQGVGRGYGLLTSRRVTVRVAVGAVPPRDLEVWLPDAQLAVTPARPLTPDLVAVKAG